MKQRLYCPHCGNVGQPRKFAKGSPGTETLLWLAFLLPGALYTIWRLTTRYPGCPRCRAPHMIPTTALRRGQVRAIGTS